MSHLLVMNDILGSIHSFILTIILTIQIPLENDIRVRFRKNAKHLGVLLVSCDSKCGKGELLYWKGTKVQPKIGETDFNYSHQTKTHTENKLS